MLKYNVLDTMKNLKPDIAIRKYLFVLWILMLPSILIPINSTAQTTLQQAPLAQNSALVQQKDTAVIPRSTEASTVPLQAPKDSLLKKKFQPDPKRAALFSALLPGLGQIYNRQYWKAPIVYALMGTSIYMVVKNQQNYQRYRKAYIARLEDPNSNDEFQGVLSLTGIKQYQDQYRQNSDMLIVASVVIYAAQIMEALSGAHLKNFDISKDLSFQMHPTILPNYTPGLTLAFQMHYKPTTNTALYSK